LRLALGNSRLLPCLSSIYAAQFLIQETQLAEQMFICQSILIWKLALTLYKTKAIKMTIYNLSLLNNQIDILSTKEICEMCFVLNQHIFVYIRDVLLGKNHLEYSQITRCYHLVRGYLKMIHHATGNGEIGILKIELHSLTCNIVNPGLPNTSVEMRLNSRCFSNLGPVALVKILVAVISSALMSFARRASTLQELDHVPVLNLAEIISSCTGGFTEAVKLLYGIIYRIPNINAYLVNNDTVFTDIHIQLDDGIDKLLFQT
jgi:hypothetical protein